MNGDVLSCGEAVTWFQIYHGQSNAIESIDGQTRDTVQLQLETSRPTDNMKALVYNGPNKIAVEDRPKPEIKEPHDAVLKMLRTTIWCVP